MQGMLQVEHLWQEVLVLLGPQEDLQPVGSKRKSGSTIRTAAAASERDEEAEGSCAKEAIILHSSLFVMA